jgi:hypothetical protein
MNTTLDASVHLNRQQRRTLASKQRRGSLSTLGGPHADWKLTERAYQIAAEKFGPERLSKGHAEAVLYMAGRITHMANGHARKTLKAKPSAPLRLAYGLACGGGKTLMAQSWMAAVHATGKPYSVAYAASEVEVLCSIKRNLTRDFGVPADKVGLLHSYTYDPDKAAKRVPGYASLPATPEAELHTKQFLLVTHSLVQTGEAALVRYNAYGPRREPRTLVLYDESLLVSDSWSLQVKNVEHGANWLRTEVKHGGARLKHLQPVLRFTEDCLKVLSRFHDGITRLPSLSDYDASLDPERTAAGLPRACPGSVATLLRGSNRYVRVLASGSRQAAWFVLRVPDELRNVFVLDASYMIRALPRLKDSNVTPDKAAPETAIDYSGVTIETFRHPAGRGTIEAECAAPWNQRPLARKLAGWIKTLPDDCPVLVWTFKHRGMGKNIPERLAQALERHGCDMSRVRIETHGRARGSNEFEDYRAVAWYGVFEPDSGNTKAQMLGELRDLDADIEPHDPRHVHRREILHELYQEMQRCHVRRIVNGRAGDARMFIPCWHQDVIAELAEPYVCPGARLIQRPELEPEEVRAKYSDGQTARTVATAVAVLLGQPAHVSKVSGKTLWRTVEDALGETVSKRVREDAIRQVAAASVLRRVGWRRSGRSFIRTDAT